MSFTIKQKLNQVIGFPDKGITVQIGEVEKDVTYTAKRVINFDGDTVTCEYDIEIDGAVSEEKYRLTFKYSGSGNPLEQADSELQNFFSLIG